jgi:hypothetical protein
MTEGLREFDDSWGRCCHCGKLIFRNEKDWVLPDPPMIESKIRLAHRKCNNEYIGRTSQM